MNDSNLPEEKLLRLIRGAKNQERAQAAAKKTSEPEVPARAVRARPFKADPALLRAVSIVVFAGSCAFLLKTLFAAPTVPQVPPSVHEGAPEQPVQEQTLEHYLQQAAASRIFGLQQQEAPAGPSSGPTDAEIADMLKDLTLMGVISGAAPQAIIEDQRTQKTYYLNKGQSLGDLQVESIQENKVILNYKGRRSELYF
jgi:type II secretory pathway component PulC